MKRFSKNLVYGIIIVFAAGLCTTSTAQEVKTAPKTKQSTESVAAKEISIKTQFHCPGGKASIEQKLQAEPGIQKVHADLASKVVTITYDAATTDQEKIVAAIENTGFRTEFTPDGKVVTHKCTHQQGDDNHDHDE
jgi:copper chaperone CopZ